MIHFVYLLKFINFTWFNKFQKMVQNSFSSAIKGREDQPPKKAAKKEDADAPYCNQYTFFFLNILRFARRF